MEDHKSELILILAGYQKEMDDFLQTNPGLRSRFPIHIPFADYDQNDLMRIAEQMCAKRQYQMPPETRLALLRLLSQPREAEAGTFGNARTVRNLIERAMRRQAVRLIDKSALSRDELMRIEPADLMEGGL